MDFNSSNVSAQRKTNLGGLLRCTRCNHNVRERAKTLRRGITNCRSKSTSLTSCNVSLIPFSTTPRSPVNRFNVYSPWPRMENLFQRGITGPVSPIFIVHGYTHRRVTQTSGVSGKKWNFILLNESTFVRGPSFALNFAPGYRDSGWQCSCLSSGTMLFNGTRMKWISPTGWN